MLSRLEDYLTVAGVRGIAQVRMRTFKSTIQRPEDGNAKRFNQDGNESEGGNITARAPTPSAATFADGNGVPAGLIRNARGDLFGQAVDHPKVVLAPVYGLARLPRRRSEL
jgi:hypothetical protein